MSSYRTRDRLLLMGIEATAGVEEALTVGTHAILVEDPVPSPNFEVIETNEVGGSLDNRAPIVGGGNFAFSGLVYMKGSGTGGTAPEYGPILRSAAMAETLTAADETGTAQAGAVGSITLAAGASAIDDNYIGMILNTTGGTGPNQTVVISDYDGTTKVATVYPDFATAPDITTTYNIFANALYAPASTSLENVTAFLYDNAALAATNSLLRKIIGAASTFNIELETRGVGKLNFTTTGILPANPTNVADPGAATFDSVRPRPFINADAYLGGTKVKFRSFGLDIGAEVQQSDDPAAQYGFFIAGVTARNITGSINPNLELLTSRNNLADFLAGTSRALWVRWGSTAGNRISIFIPSALYTGAEPSDTDGFNAENLPFKADGIDTGVYISVY